AAAAGVAHALAELPCAAHACGHEGLVHALGGIGGEHPHPDHRGGVDIALPQRPPLRIHHLHHITGLGCAIDLLHLRGEDPRMSVADALLGVVDDDACLGHAAKVAGGGAAKRAVRAAPHTSPSRTCPTTRR